MRMRGSCYYKWANSQLPNFSHVEDYGADTHIDVVVRSSRQGITQLFLGIYNGNGVMLFEQYLDALPERTTTQALQWGIERARAFIDGAECRKVVPLSAARHAAADRLPH